MALTIAVDSVGVYATLGCDWLDGECGAHVSARPYRDDRWSTRRIAMTVGRWAQGDGWLLDGTALCPQHRRALAYSEPVKG